MQSVHAEGRPRHALNLRAAAALAGIAGGACGSDGASGRRTRKEVQMKRSTKAANAKSSGPKKPPRRGGSKAAEGQKAGKPIHVRRTRNRASREPGPAAAAPRQSKQATVIALLSRPEGATVAEVVAATGWQPHTVRGLFSGTLKKKLGLELGSVPADRGRVYRIVDPGRTSEAARTGG